jgi:predicted acylesterase/phospholipase RssA
MVFAMSKHNMNAGIPTIFRSYRARANQTLDCTIWEALCASTAHPGHFKSIEIGDPLMRESFVAGAMGCNNPIVHALEEIKSVCPDQHVACIVSIGAGHVRTIHIPEPSPLMHVFPTDVGTLTTSIATDSERVARDMAVRFQGTTDVYFRLSVEQGMQEIELDDWDKLGKVMAHTRVYMRHPEVHATINRIVTAIRERKEAIPTAQIGTSTPRCSVLGHHLIRG